MEKRFLSVTDCPAWCNLRDTSKWLVGNEKWSMWPFSHKGFHSVWNATFSHEDAEKSANDSTTFWTPKSNIIVRAPLPSSRHQLLLLVLIENPQGPSWKHCSALEKRYEKRLCPSYQNVASEGCSTSTPAQLFYVKKRKAGESSETISLLFEMTVTTGVTTESIRADLVI